MAKLLTSSRKRRNLSKADIRVGKLPEDMHVEMILANENPLFCVTIDGEYLRTPNGVLIAHEDERAIRELAAEIDFLDQLDVTNISLYNLCSTKIDFVDPGKEEFTRDSLVLPLLGDSVLMPCAGPEYVDQMKYLQIVVDYLEENNIKYPNLPQIPIFDGMEEFIDENIINGIQPLAEFVNDSILHLNNWERTVFITVSHAFNSPVLGLMLAKKTISPQEFAVTYYTSLAVNSKIWGDTNRREEQKLLEACTKYAECMVRFLDQFAPKLTEAERIIQIGESITVEFKSTLRWNIRESRQDPKMEHAVLKTVAAFMNSDGGTLLVGVEDNKNVIGLELDDFENDDKFMLHFTNMVNTKIGKGFFPLIKYEVQKAFGGKVLLIGCRKSPIPVSLKVDNKDVFYVRAGPSTLPMSKNEILEYWKTRSS
jgi:chaperone required for assembly of F1-ATPase